MKNKRLITACVGMLAFAALTSCLRPATVKNPPSAPPAANSNPSPSITPQREERLVIAYEGEDGKTVLELLKKHARVSTATSQLGELVEVINGVSSGNGHYYIYFVNGRMASVGAAQLLTKNGDRIEWKLIGPRKQ